VPADDSARERSQRDIEAYERGVHECSHAWHLRARHVLEGPSARRQLSLWWDLVAEAARGRRVLEVGCGAGMNASAVSEIGASYVLGIDVTESFIEQASKRSRPGKVEFALADANEPIAGRFDLILGQAVLHHLDLRQVLPQLARDNLSEHGRMLFLEPLGHPVSRVFHALVRSAHTPDERLLDRRALSWLRREFGARITPADFVSFPVGIVSTSLASTADNVVMRSAARIDQWIADTMPWLHPYFRYGIIEIGPITSST
jgi:SAM-dependent methyltransferase